MTGSGGAVSSVDRDASQVGIDVLARGGNAADAAGAVWVWAPAAAGSTERGSPMTRAPRTHRERVVVRAL